MAKTLQITSDDPEWISQQIDKWQYPPNETGEAYLEALKLRLNELTASQEED